MIIRKASLNDLDKIFDIEKRVFSNPWSKKSIKNELNRISCSLNFISEKNDHLIGYCFSHMIDKEIHILNIFIKQKTATNYNIIIIRIILKGFNILHNTKQQKYKHTHSFNI